MANTKQSKYLRNKESIIRFILISCCNLFAQNNFAHHLVSNPSFEQLKEYPTPLNASHTPIERFCEAQESVGIQGAFMSGGGCQYLHECAKAPYDQFGLPQSVFGYQYAHTGKAVSQIANTCIGFY